MHDLESQANKATKAEDFALAFKIRSQVEKMKAGILADDLECAPRPSKVQPKPTKPKPGDPEHMRAPTKVFTFCICTNELTESISSTHHSINTDINTDTKTIPGPAGF